MIELKLLIMAVCAALFWWGGYSWHNARRFVMPAVLSLTSCFLCHSLWPLTMLTCMGALCLGYGEKSPLRRIFGDGWGRGVWGLLASACLAVPLLVTHHLAFLLFVLYLALNFTLENVLKKMPQFIGDPIIGLGLASILLLIH